jgi:hypothetical protein
MIGVWRKPMRIRQGILAFILIFMSDFVGRSGIANAEITEPQTPFSMLCVPDKATGFNQINGEWDQVKVEPTAYTLIKLSSDHPDCKSAALAEMFSQPIKAGRSIGCYRFKEVGQEGSAQSCSEEWEAKDGGYVLWATFCDGLQSVRATVDGPYVRWNANFIEDTDSDKDLYPLFLEVGRCRLLSNP